jgi:hypothetical protein
VGENPYFAVWQRQLFTDSVGCNLTTKTKKGGAVMLSGGEVAIIRAEIARLEKALGECTDGGIRERIKTWLEEEKEGAW